MRLRAAVGAWVLLAGGCVSDDTTESSVAEVSSALGFACDTVEPLALDYDAVMPSTKLDAVLAPEEARCYVLRNPCPGWLAVDARPLGGGTLELEVHEDFDRRLEHGRSIEKSRSHHFELQAVHAFVQAHDPHYQVVRMRAGDSQVDETRVSLFVAFLPRSQRCAPEPP